MLKLCTRTPKNLSFYPAKCEFIFSQKRYLSNSVTCYKSDLKLVDSSSLHKKIFNKLYFFSYYAANYRLGLIGAVLYENIVDKLDYDHFYKEYSLEDTFFSWFLITEVHLWILMLRVMQNDESGLALRNSIVKAMWNDISIRTKKLENTNSSLLKSQLKILSEQFNASIMGYDEAIQLNDIFLAGHVWRRFFECNETSPRQLENLIYYIRKQVQFLNSIPTSEIFTLTPKICWKIND